MTPAIEKFLNDLDHLTYQERQLALREVLKRSQDYYTEPMTDDELNSLADELFQLLNGEEHN